MALYNLSETSEWDFEGYLFQRKHAVIDFPKSWFLPVFGCTAYLCFVYLGRKFMEERKRYELRTPMLLWSIFLAVFSIVGSLRYNVKIVERILDSGFRGGVCYSDPLTQIPILRFWGTAFVYSKFVEYFDTVFIILRKQNLSFLHWYHHATVSIYCWYNYNNCNPGGYLFAAINYSVHAIMYTYYSLRAAKLKPPKIFAMFITILQTSQMVVGCVVVGAMVFWGNEEDCKSSKMQRFYGIVMYASYLVLFLNFFYHAYIEKSRKKKSVEEVKSRASAENKTEESSENSLRQRIRTKTD